MDLEDLFKGKHRRERRDQHDEGWTSGGEGHPWHRERHDRHYGHAPHVALTLLRAVLARPWVLAAAAGVLLVVLVAGIWISIQLLGYVGEHGVKGLVEMVLGLGTRLWEGR